MGDVIQFPQNGNARTRAANAWLSLAAWLRSPESQCRKGLYPPTQPHHSGDCEGDESLTDPITRFERARAELEAVLPEARP